MVKINHRSQVPFGDDYHPCLVYFTEVFSMFTGVQWGLGRRTVCEEIFVDNESLIIKGSLVRNFRSYEQLDSPVKW